MIRENLKNEIVAKLRMNSYFDPNDFEINSSTERNTVILKLQYSYEPLFQLTAKIPSTTTSVKTKYDENLQIYEIDCEVSPGDLSIKEKLTLQNREGLLTQIGKWLENIKADMLARPLNRALEEQRKKIAEFEAKLSEMPDEYFTKAEAAELRAKMDEFASKTEAAIKASEEDKEFQKAEIQRLKEEMESLKINLESLMKKAWFKSFYTRVVSWGSKKENRELVQAGMEAIKGYIGSE